MGAILAKETKYCIAKCKTSKYHYLSFFVISKDIHFEYWRNRCTLFSWNETLCLSQRLSSGGNFLLAR